LFISSIALIVLFSAFSGRTDRYFKEHVFAIKENDQRTVGMVD
jgi:hypothetical protein